MQVKFEIRIPGRFECIGLSQGSTICAQTHTHAEMEMGQWVMGHRLNGSPFLDGSRGSRVTASDPLTHDDEITAQ